LILTADACERREFLRAGQADLSQAERPIVVCFLLFAPRLPLLAPGSFMRCLVVADLHYSLPQFDWLLSAAPLFDAVIFAGDALDVASIVDFRAQIVVVKKYFALLSETTRVMLCSGNHDLDVRSEVGEKIARWIGELRDIGIACDGESLRLDDILFTVCPWWDGPLVKARIDAQLADAASSRLRQWIWVHHAPPADSPTSWGGKRHFGDIELSQWIGRHEPSIVICGHVHQSPFITNGSWYDRIGATWVFNTGLQPGRPPSHIVLDLDRGKAYWLAVGQAQWIDLHAPLHRPAQAIVEPPDWLISLGRIADPILARPAEPAG
jgi:Icc-related predicted phosphoesterase